MENQWLPWLLAIWTLDGNLVKHCKITSTHAYITTEYNLFYILCLIKKKYKLLFYSRAHIYFSGRSNLQSSDVRRHGQQSLNLFLRSSVWPCAKGIVNAALYGNYRYEGELLTHTTCLILANDLARRRTTTNRNVGPLNKAYNKAYNNQ